MPSRRDYLTGVAAAGIGGVAGCMDYLTRTTGTVFRKTVSVAYPRGPYGLVWTDVAFLGLGGDRRTAIARYDPEYTTVDGESVALSVSTAQHEAMTQRFAAVQYIAGVVPETAERGPIRAAHRADFNRMLLGGRATVGEDTTDDGRTYFRLYDTDPRQRDLAMEDVARIDVDDKF